MATGSSDEMMAAIPDRCMQCKDDAMDFCKVKAKQLVIMMIRRQAPQTWNRTYNMYSGVFRDDTRPEYDRI